MTSAEIPVLVDRIETVAQDIKRLRFVSADGSRLPTYSAGSHTILTMRDGSKLYRNAYSLMGPLDSEAGYEISVLKTPTSRGGSRFVHDYLHEGSAVTISSPVNLFELDLRARKHLLIAGGIGITPIMSMAEQLEKLGRLFEIHYATRTSRSGAYVGELKRKFGARVRHYQTDRSEFLDTDVVLCGQPLGTHLYVCGPAGMINDVLQRADHMGWPSQHLHAEHFTAPRSGAPFDVELAKTNRTIRVQADESILQALEAAGVEAPCLCRGGACGQCETPILSCNGSIQHEDHYLTDEEKKAGDKIMICVSRIQGSRLTLDL
ncbi:PDR/VanB family oxidoreductase [Hyphomicrobium sp.]|uniref:PDR/VanB family oxidoreductase n=1 Tax=Hyphomicrobium sp. TaxID=82 RepID=UPI002E326BCD|nr:PDR/VanB family oxidoreductase [Hyphomicrobium sp.]HEX2840033.1 PDR/VanB family oxidoreductase [Hyphomicrobium sp.]